MAINDKGLIQATRGTIFVAPAETALPDDLSQFTLNTESVGDWQNFGHTSNDNKLSWNVDGGDATSHDTWLVAGARTTYASTTLTFTGNSVQTDADTLKTIYNAWVAESGLVIASVEKVEQKLAFVILGYDPGNDEYFGTYLPNVSFTYSNLPDFSGDNFVELSFTGTANASTTLPVSPSGRRGTYAFIPPELFSAKNAKPVVSVAVSPATASVKVGETAKLTVAFTPADATNQKYTATSSDDTKATVAVSGTTVTVTGVAATAANTPVTVTVTSADGAKTATAAITVAAKA